MKIVALTDEVTILKTLKPDKWGLPTDEVEKIQLPAKVSMQLHNDRGNDDMLIPKGSLLLEGRVIVSSSDYILVGLTDDQQYKVKPDTIKHIKDLTDNVIYTKVSFNG